MKIENDKDTLGVRFTPESKEEYEKIFSTIKKFLEENKYVEIIIVSATQWNEQKFLTVDQRVFERISPGFTKSIREAFSIARKKGIEPIKKNEHKNLKSTNE